TTVILEASGDLRTFQTLAAPSCRAPDGRVDWRWWFETARLNPGDFVTAEPGASVGVPHDRQFAWQARGGVAPVVQGALLDGCVVYFRVGREGAPADIGSGAVFTTHRGAVAEAFFWTAIVVVFVGAIALTIRNVTRERGHRQAANWIAIIVLGGGVVAGLPRAHHVPSVIEETSFVLGVTGWSAIWAAFCWVGYLGLEPPLRRHAPQVLGAWTRVFAGRLRDSVVGRDVLIGVAGGLALVALATIRFRLWPDRSAAMVLYHALETLRSWRRFTFVQLLAALDAVQTAVAAGLLVALVRPIVRRVTVAACLVALLSIPISIGGIPLSPKDGALAATVMLIGAVIFL